MPSYREALERIATSRSGDPSPDSLRSIARDALAAFRPLEIPPAWRQSHIATFESCPLELRFTLESRQTHGSDLAARGTLFHRFAAAALNHMRREKERSLPPDMAMELLTQVIAQRDVPDDEVVHVPMEELRWLRVLVMRWVYGGRPEPGGRLHDFSTDRIHSVEGRLSAPLTVQGPDGQRYERVITGKPDVLLYGPAAGEATCIDWKSGWQPPPRRVERRNGDAPKEDRLSNMGFVQQTVYGWLVLKNFPSIERVTEREYYVMEDDDDNRIRKATVWRYELERIEDVLAGVVAQMDAAVEAGPESPRWIPVAGTQCGYCPRPHDCPIKDELGIPANEADAQRLVQGWHVAGEVRKRYRPLLYGYVDKHGPIEVRHSKGRRYVGWVEAKNGEGRSFRLYEPDDAPEPLHDPVIDPILEEAARRARVLLDG